MTQEQKELLLKDLCTRLPYGVKVEITRINWYSYKEEVVIKNIKSILPSIYAVSTTNMTYGIQDVKPYLFPLSSMTEEQLYNNPIGFSQMLTIKADRDWENITINRRAYYKLVDWFNKNHFDYRGLIEKVLAIDATGLNIY